MRVLLLSLAVSFCLVGCGAEPTQPKKPEVKSAPVKKEDKRNDHLLENVQDGPTYGDRMLRTYQGAKDVKKQIDQQVQEQKDLQKDMD